MATTSRRTELAPTDRLRVSPSFVLAFAMDGRPYVAKDTEPYIQYWLSERYRVLLSIFGGRRGASVRDAFDAYARVTRTGRSAAERSRLLAAIRDLHAAGVLMHSRDDTSRYSERIVDDYVTHRPFPRELAELVANEAALGPSTRVLDLAGGPGDLALALARRSPHVALMDLSRAFLKAASRRAMRLGLPLSLIHDSANRLVYRDDDFDVVTVSQALHWLDDVLVARGVCRVLRSGGSFFVIHGAMEVDDAHPFASVLGRESIFGRKPRRDFADEVRPLLRRLTLLFDALDAPDVERLDLSQRWTDAATGDGHGRIVPAGVSIFRQRRPLGLGYIRGFLTDAHIRSIGLEPAPFWSTLEAVAAEATDEELMGTHHWAVLHFRRGGARLATDVRSAPVVDIAFEGAGIPVAVSARS
ncbi:MAG: class I SAM-dependent methyltransferase [Vicinamibacterales bacterium]